MTPVFNISSDGWFALMVITALVTWTIRHFVNRWALVQVCRALQAQGGDVAKAFEDITGTVAKI